MVLLLLKKSSLHIRNFANWPVSFNWNDSNASSEAALSNFTFQTSLVLGNPLRKVPWSWKLARCLGELISPQAETSCSRWRCSITCLPPVLLAMRNCWSPYLCVVSPFPSHVCGCLAFSVTGGCLLLSFSGTFMWCAPDFLLIMSAAQSYVEGS